LNMVFTQKNLVKIFLNKIADEYTDSVSTDSITGCLSYCSMRHHHGTHVPQSPFRVNKFSLLWGEAQLYFALCLPKEKEINRNVLKIIYYRRIHQQIYNKVSNYNMNLKLITYS